MPIETRTPDGRELDDRLEPPTLNARALSWIGLGALGFILAVLGVLAAFYHLLLKNPASQPVQPFPIPRLETNIDPRHMPATPEPGPAPATRKTPPVEPPADMDRAMRAVAAKGQRAFDPLAATSGNTSR